MLTTTKGSSLCVMALFLTATVQMQAATQLARKSAASGNVNTAAHTMTNSDVVELVRLGMSDGVIIDKIYATKDVNFDTSVAAMKSLKAFNVSDDVIRAMINPTRVPSANASPTNGAEDHPKHGSTDDKIRILVVDRLKTENDVAMERIRDRAGWTNDKPYPKASVVIASMTTNCPANVVAVSDRAQADFYLVLHPLKQTTINLIMPKDSLEGGELYTMNTAVLAYKSNKIRINKVIADLCSQVRIPAR